MLDAPDVVIMVAVVPRVGVGTHVGDLLGVSRGRSAS